MEKDRKYMLGVADFMIYILQTESEVGKAGVDLEAVFHGLVQKYLPYFKSWVEVAHEAVLQEPKVKRRKRDPSGKEGKDGKPKEKGEGDKKDRRSPTVKEKNKKQLDKIPVLLPPLTQTGHASKAPLPELPMEELGEKGSILSNLGLVRNAKGQDTLDNDDSDHDMEEMGQGEGSDNREHSMDDGRMDLPSDPICDPNDENIDSSQGIAGNERDGKLDISSETNSETEKKEQLDLMSIDDAPIKETMDGKPEENDKGADEEGKEKEKGDKQEVGKEGDASKMVESNQSDSAYQAKSMEVSQMTGIDHDDPEKDASNKEEEKCDSKETSETFNKRDAALKEEELTSQKDAKEELSSIANSE